MPKLTPAEIDHFIAVIGENDYLRRLLGEIERLQQAVFHANPSADWNNVRQSSEQILIAEIVLRHGRHHDAIFYALRNAEDSGKLWDAAIRDMAANIHAYYTTPLGLLMRRELFGENTVFVSPDAIRWMHQQSHSANPGT
ncbi:MAG: hypothetical protein JNG88_12000 [Phycisphaerales bacterium]|nr:hypothetical protein [Phycisphaerales bacterium]